MAYPPATPYYPPAQFEEPSGSNTGLVVGLAIGGIVILGGIGVGAYFLLKPSTPAAQTSDTSGTSTLPTAPATLPTAPTTAPTTVPTATPAPFRCLPGVPGATHGFAYLRRNAVSGNVECYSIDGKNCVWGDTGCAGTLPDGSATALECNSAAYNTAWGTGGADVANPSHWCNKNRADV